MIEKATTTIPTVTADQLAKLRQLMPHVFGENGKLDFDKFQACLGNQLDSQPERFNFSWAGKQQAIKLLQIPSRATLVPAIAESVNYDTTHNLFIEGDNLEVLKLLFKSYFEQVKMIYLDPPYNTGNDFVYPDNYQDPLEIYLKLSGQMDSQGNLLTSNSNSSGRFHSAWLSMMYPRLLFARQLLRDDGVIFISIDDNEAANLRLLMNEIFGEENFIATIIWERAYSPVNLKKHFSESHDYIFCYAKNLDNLSCNGLLRDDEATERYKNPDNDARGVWKSTDLSVGPVVANKIYEIITPTGRVVLPPEGRCWIYTKQRFEEMLADNRIWFGETGNNVPSVKKFLSEVKNVVTPMTIWKYSEVGHSQDAAQKLKALFEGKSFFNYPKSVELIKRMLQLYTDEKSIVLDLFAGSCTTAQAVLELNREDGGHRQFICVQLPEPCPLSSEAFKAGYGTVAEVGKERIRRVIKRMTTADPELPQVSPHDTAMDMGFRVFKLVASHFKQWHMSPEITPTAYIDQMALFIDPLIEGWQVEPVIYELALKEGYPLTSKFTIAPHQHHLIYQVSHPDGESKFHVCLDERVDLKLIAELGLGEGDIFICRDQAIDDTMATNIALQCHLKVL